ncbi:UNVERIFIED_CONTAM: hypothetical protein HDU68_010093 [Siphonaria sp. JEL0065]|nr:hypothetical protein HDU68_010093 [Siphonaria sp. JEL0065]
MAAIATTPLGEQVDALLQFSYFVDLLQDSDVPAIRSVDNRGPLSHHQLKAFIKDNELSTFGINRSSRVGILLPEGPELGSCLVTVMASCCAIPINYHLTDAEVVAELTILGSTTVILSNPKDGLIELLLQSGIMVLVLIPDEVTCGIFKLQAWIADANEEPIQTRHLMSRVSTPFFSQRSKRMSSRLSANLSIPRSTPTLMERPTVYSHHAGPNDIAMILRTSGTSGNKKTVPYTLKTLVIGAICVAESWGLERGVDINLNMMPLYHVGGIVRNLLAPILSGSTVIITGGFDATAFWDILQTQSPTWYFAVPTMHLAILDEGTNVIKKGNRSTNGRDTTRLETSIRMIANAGGGLPHSLALRLREMFQGSIVLPSYGMTECMPIATPPLTYNLEKPGCSGIAVGPAIAIKDDNGNSLAARKFGRITVRGPPTFHTYEGNLEATAEAFTADGFFDTGDMGYLDEDGYLFVTGRSKEVINRGGEIISPVEVEDAVLRHPKVQTAIAFSISHDVLQETIGIVVVPKQGVSRVGLSQLQKFVATILHPSKWPQLIVYMNDLPKNQAGKPLRIKLAERMNIEEINDSMSFSERSYEATCPPIGTLLSVAIPAQRVSSIDPSTLQNLLLNKFSDSSILVTLFDEQPIVFMEHNLLLDTGVRSYLMNRVHDYEIPDHIIVLHKIPRDDSGEIDELKCLDLFAEMRQESLTDVEKFVVGTFQKVLGLGKPPRSIEDFFEIGGNSLSSGKVISLVRAEYGVKLLPMALFKHRTAKALAIIIEEDSSQELQKDYSKKQKQPYRPRSPKSQSPTTFVVLFIQSLPVLLFRPMPLFIFWMLFVHFLAWLSEIPFFDSANLNRAKWLIIGRYRQGSYPFWGSYYLRWWTVDQLLSVFGAGFFHTTDELYCLYLRLMGARIGWNVRVSGISIVREYDLIHIHPNSSVSDSIVRAFTVETGLMVLKPIVIDRNCVVNVKSTIAPGSILPPNTVLPPRSSSYELEDSSQKHRIFAYSGGISPSLYTLLFIGFPIVGLVELFSAVPWLACMYWLVQFPFFSNASEPSFESVSKFGQFLLHQAQLYRIGIHILGVAARALICPLFKLAATIFLKRVIIGKFKPGQRTSNQWQIARIWIMRKLLGAGELCGMYFLLGRHYEGISTVYRILGAKIGKRVYWPGTPIPFHEFDLFEVGDDVVFGSRSILVFTDAVESRPIVFGAGSMIADRCVILPGVTVGQNAMIGSGSLLYKNGHYAAGSTWVGSKGGDAVLWDQGNRIIAERSPTLKPFGKAFYLRDASYSVFSEGFIVLTNMVLTLFSKICWNLAPLLGVISSGSYFNTVVTRPTSFLVIDVIGNLVFTFAFFGVYSAVSCLAVAIAISAKWLVIGKRTPGSYDWDKSDYCQRWQLYISLQSMQSGLLGAVRGSHLLVMYFRALGCNIGENVCLYPTGGDPMMTEPDLISIGSHTVIDQASVVAHINSRGNFDLNELKIGESCVLKTDSRLLSGAEMEEGSKLLEHTLIVGGEVVDSGMVMQGWPASEVESLDSITNSSTIDY